MRGLWIRVQKCNPMLADVSTTHASVPLQYWTHFADGAFWDLVFQLDLPCSARPVGSLRLATSGSAGRSTSPFANYMFLNAVFRTMRG